MGAQTRHLECADAFPNATHIEAHEVPKTKYDPRELLTILTATSPIAYHPSLDIILHAIESLGRHAGLSGCRHLVVCDGCGNEDPLLAERYQSYKSRLRMVAGSGLLCTRVEVHELPRRVGLPGVILAGSSYVRTPYLLVYEHDWQIVRPIDTSGILRTLATSRGVQYIRLNKKRTREGDWDFVLKPDVRRRPVPLVRTSAWSATPHFSKMSYYRRMILPHLTERPDGGPLGFEEGRFSSLCREIRTVGFDRAHRRWGVFIYGRLGDPPVVIHLDGQRSRRAEQEREDA
jgi:hypothetical protein